MAEKNSLEIFINSNSENNNLINIKNDINNTPGPNETPGS